MGRQGPDPRHNHFVRIAVAWKGQGHFDCGSAWLLAARPFPPFSRFRPSLSPRHLPSFPAVRLFKRHSSAQIARSLRFETQGRTEPGSSVDHAAMALRIAFFLLC